MNGLDRYCPNCGHLDLDPRDILVGVMGPVALEMAKRNYRKIITLKCQDCGWLGEEEPLLKQA